MARRLDGVVTLIDAKHIEQHLDEEKPEGAENEAVEQVAPRRLRSTSPHHRPPHGRQLRLLAWVLISVWSPL